jgi:hypothetical protein
VFLQFAIHAHGAQGCKKLSALARFFSRKAPNRRSVAKAKRSSARSGWISPQPDTLDTNHGLSSVFTLKAQPSFSFIQPLNSSNIQKLGGILNRMDVGSPSANQDSSPLITVALAYLNRIRTESVFAGTTSRILCVSDP